ncbi:hypothetical protein ACIBSW_32205 [Actinoplanes sp. NPDC049668]|uniref:hypothetical protein n=1 Tax=unclassified Actinoplanes TaxID=2626549 RepID=UPI0033A94585
MIGEANIARPSTRRTDRWVAAFGVLALLCGGLFALSLTYSRAAASRSQSAERSIRAALDRQGAALLRGDRTAWLSTVEEPLSGDWARLYANLRGLQVSGWLPRTRGVAGGPVWDAEVQIRVCFAAPTCTRTPETYVPLGDVISARTKWTVSGDRAVLTGFEQSTTDGPVPWKSETLTFATGTRVVVAAPQHLPGAEPARWLPAAERAAQVADRYALTDPKPGRYLVFLAGAREWNTAVGTDREAAAFVDRTSESTAFAVVDATGLGADFADEILLRHELGHIATLLGTLDNGDEWAVEGMAEYIAYAGRPVKSYELILDARWHVEHTGWRGRLDLEWSTDPSERFGFYAMGFLAMRCIAQEYGEPRLLRFFTEVVRRGESPEEASRSALGVPWDAVERACRPIIAGWVNR